MYKALSPTATDLLPLVSVLKALSPIAILLPPTVKASPFLLPNSTFFIPVVTWLPASCPTAVFKPSESVVRLRSSKVPLPIATFLFPKVFDDKEA